jgi:hypothetical protein
MADNLKRCPLESRLLNDVFFLFSRSRIHLGLRRFAEGKGAALSELPLKGFAVCGTIRLVLKLTNANVMINGRLIQVTQSFRTQLTHHLIRFITYIV